MLTDKQRRFVSEYMRDMNATAAYIRAGYSPAGADTHGSRLLRSPEVQRAITAKQAELEAVSGWNMYRVIKNYEAIIEDMTVKPRDRITALQALTRLLGLDRQRVQVEAAPEALGIIEIPAANEGIY